MHLGTELPGKGCAPVYFMLVLVTLSVKTDCLEASVFIFDDFNMTYSHANRR